MKSSATIAVEDPEEEIAALVRSLHETQQRLLELAGGELDAVMLPGGESYLLHEAQEKLRRSEASLLRQQVELRALFDLVPAMIFFKDTKSRILRVNQRAAEVTGMAVAEIEGKTDAEIFPNEAAGYYADDLEVIRSRSPKLGIVEKLRGPDGQELWVQTDKVPYFDQNGKVIGLVAMVQDITARKRVQQSLQESEERFRQTSAQLAKVLDSSLDVICTFDASGCFIQVSAACETIWGYRPDELLGTPYIERVLPEDRPKTMACATDILAGNPTRNFENRFVRKDGSITHVMWSAWWSEAEQSMFCVARDNSEARKAEAESWELAERLELAAKASKVGIWDWDIATGAMLWDDQMYELYGATPDSLQREGVELWHRYLHPDDHERANAEIAEALQPGGRPFDTVFRILVPPHGVIRHIHAQSRVFRDAADQPIRMLGTNWDVTGQVERENMLRQKLEDESILLQKALAGEKAKSEFLAVMSHEIRTPMNGVLGFAEMLAQSPTLSPEDRDLSQTIVSSGEALLRILDDILDFSRIEAGQLSIEKRALSPADIVEGIQALFTRQIHEKGLEFMVSLDASLPAALSGDAGRIRQILVNLLGNALKFTEQGSIELAARASMETHSSGVMEFSVRDTGSGITPDRAGAIFEAFTQADSSISRRHGGTGLGLTISRRLAGLMGGDLRMSSRADGTTFSLRIPFALDELPAIAGPANRSTDLEMDEGFAIRHPQRILVVEDDRVNLKLIVSVLRKLGFDPLTARNGLEAVTVYERENPDCVLMDMQMPEMDGLAATRNIRAMECTRSLKAAYISALTANILPEDQQRCFDAGMNAYLNKPVKRQTLANVLVDAWNSRQRQKERAMGCL